jgi:excisionase family DNA binding protein
MQTNEIATRADVKALEEKLNRIETTLQSIVGVRPDDNELLDRKKAAKLLQVSIATVAVMTHNGQLKGGRVGRQYRYLRKDVLKARENVKDQKYKR